MYVHGCRVPFIEVTYLRPPPASAPASKAPPQHAPPQHVLPQQPALLERSVIFLVDGWSVAQPDAGAAEKVEKAKGAAAAEAAAWAQVEAAEDALKEAEKVRLTCR